MERSYGQICPAARALDLLGQRWSLLIVRNLLVAPMRYGELHASLPGLTTNLLAQRLKELVGAGLVIRSDVQGLPEYELTPLGEEIRAVLYALAEIGTHLPSRAPARGEIRPALLSLCRTRRPRFDGELELRIDEDRPLYLHARDGRLTTGNLPASADRVLCVASSSTFLAALFQNKSEELRLVGEKKHAQKWRLLLATQSAT
jgi:DNA-binding HxlR family transcriptional regulator